MAAWSAFDAEDDNPCRARLPPRAGVSSAAGDAYGAAWTRGLSGSWVGNAATRRTRCRCSARGRRGYRTSTRMTGGHQAWRRGYMPTRPAPWPSWATCAEIDAAKDWAPTSEGLW
jgi:hypothetical protein